MKEARDFQVTARLVKLMTAIRNLDTVSVRGERKVGTGIAFPGAKAVLKGFDFNEKAKLERVLKKPYSVNTVTGVITVAGLKPKLDIKCPKGATHVKITGGWARIDFAAEPGQGELILTNQVTLALKASPTNLVLTPLNLPSGMGKDIFVLQLVFVQVVNGVEFSLKNGEHNTMGIIEIG
ncbi:MAG: hypothetical protein JNK73_13460 [Bacteroidia bacterium]|nr:hypothetical protein [Bacteroidia bacterium]